MLSPTGDTSMRQSSNGKGSNFQMSQSVVYQQQKRQSYQINKELRIKFWIRDFLEGKFVTILMSLVTIFALVGDDVRLWATSQEADVYFFIGLQISFVLFTLEVLAGSVVIDGFKYSFFFYLDIVATLSIISDIPWMLDMLIQLVGEQSSDFSVDAIPGVMYTESVSQGKIAQVFKSLRLIRLIRIIKLYKYIIQSKQRNEEDQANNKNKKKKVVDASQLDAEGINPEETESAFKRETDPSKLGKALSDQNTREVIIGVLLMLMVLPLLSPSEIDYSQEFGLRELFWIGRSSCEPPADNHHPTELMDNDLDQLDHIFCAPEEEPWITEDGWFELLRQYTVASKLTEDYDNTWELLWIYIPDWTNKGQMNTIEMVPRMGNPYDPNDPDPYWREETACAGFALNKETCPWRMDEMHLVTFTPDACVNGDLVGCEYLVAYARILNRSAIQE